MSLFATVSGARLDLPRQQFPSRTSVLQEELCSSEFLPSPAILCNNEEGILRHIFSFFDENHLVTTASSVCTRWSKIATEAHADLLFRSVQDVGHFETTGSDPILERRWNNLHAEFPWACFLAEGGAKRVYKAFNSITNRYEALSVMYVPNPVWTEHVI